MANGLRLTLSLTLGLCAALFTGISSPRAGFDSERRIEMFNIHTGENISIVYKKDGQYIPEALEKLNYFMRDWRANKQTRMDPHTIDLVWEIHEELGSKVPVHLICGYRSSGTNEALRNSGGGQAKFSQHILGKAMDVTFPDIPVQKLRYAGLVREGGGVGYYPTSGVPFVHIDTGSVRMWPRMPRFELALLFPSGHSKYVPEDNRPISSADVSYARSHYTQMAEAIAAFHQFRGQAKDRVMVANLEATGPAAQTGGISQIDASSDDPAPPPPELAQPPAASIARSAAQHAPAMAQVASLDETAVSETGEAPQLSGPALSASATAVQTRAPALRPPASKVMIKASKPLLARVSLVSLASLVPPKPALAVRPGGPSLVQTSVQPQSGALDIAATVSAADTSQDPVPPEPKDETVQTAFMDKAGWVSEPGYDEDHDSELSYRPFPLAGLIDATPTSDNAVLSKLVRPNLAAAHQAIGSDVGLAMQFRPTLEVAEMIWNDSTAGRDSSGDLYAQAAGSNAGQGTIVHTASAN